MGNPNIPQGQLNRIRGSVTWESFAGLNVTSPYLGRNGISLSLEGDATVFIQTLTGTVQSQEVMLKATLSLHLLRTQQLADLYKSQLENNSFMGDGTVRPDVVKGGIGPFQIQNCGIQSVGPMIFNGTEEGFNITIGGFYSINSALFNAS